jgi:hypothetical protein
MIFVSKDFNVFLRWIQRIHWELIHSRQHQRKRISWKEVNAAGWELTGLEIDRQLSIQRGFGGRMMIKGREEEEFSCEVA